MLLTTYHMLLTTYIFSRRLDNKRPCCVLYGLDLMDPFILHLGIWWISCCGHHTHVIQCLNSMTWTLMTFCPSQFVRGERLGWLRSLSFSADGNLPWWETSHWWPPSTLPADSAAAKRARGDRTMSTHWVRFGAGHSYSWFKSAADSSGHQLVKALLLVTTQKDQQKPIVKGSFSFGAGPLPLLHSIQ